MKTTKERAQKLREVLPLGYISIKAALVEAGFTVHQIDNYLKAGELEPLASGVYKMPYTKLSWEGVVASLERLGSDISVGALTSLENAGHGHYLAMAQRQKLYLYSSSRPPSWLNNILPDFEIKTRTHAKLLTPHRDNLALFEHRSSFDNPTISFLASRLELAILEFLQGVPNQASFEHADLLMEGLATLSPTRLNHALTCCNNIKVKRLFLWLARRHNHSWLNSLDVDQFELGRGKRVIASPGVLDKNLKITVPKDMHATQE